MKSQEQGFSSAQRQGVSAVTYSIIAGGVPGTGNLNVDPRLSDQAEDGGFAPTHALLPSSHAIDAGSPSICPRTDQRGMPRPVDGDGNGSAVCDVGALEYGAPD